MRRLQRADFTLNKAKLHLVAFTRSQNGHICGYYAPIGSNKPKFIHWMNDKEIELFNASDHTGLVERKWRQPQMNEKATMIENTAYAVANIKRYTNFTIVNDPKPFSEMFKDRPIPLVQVHLMQRLDQSNDIVGFAGAFRWDDNVAHALDGDTYNANALVYAYNWFTDDDGNMCLDICVGYDW